MSAFDLYHVAAMQSLCFRIWNSSWNVLSARLGLKIYCFIQHGRRVKRVNVSTKFQMGQVLNQLEMENNRE